ncbi:MAG: hypothetical protein M3Y81_08720 [Chloroflexota bacterium]|nr:hypothetical protein [Chloroflexota bacterium]
MFVQGILRVQEEPYRDELDLVLSDGETLFLFYEQPWEIKNPEEFDTFDALLESGKYYELLIIVRVLRSITYSPTVPPGTSFKLVPKEREGFKHNELLQGTVLDPSWDAAHLRYQAIVTSKIYNQRYVLLETSVGNVVISHAALQKVSQLPLEDIAIGGYMEWSPSRLDVLAIIEKRETPPPDDVHFLGKQGEMTP